MKLQYFPKRIEIRLTGMEMDALFKGNAVKCAGLSGNDTRELIIMKDPGDKINPGMKTKPSDMAGLQMLLSENYKRNEMLRNAEKEEDNAPAK